MLWVRGLCLSLGPKIHYPHSYHVDDEPCQFGPKKEKPCQSHVGIISFVYWAYEFAKVVIEFNETCLGLLQMNRVIGEANGDGRLSSTRLVC